MAWSGGTYSRVHNWAADDAASIDIESTRMDQEDDSIATGIDTCLTKDGQNTPTTNLPMAANRHTGVGNAAAKTDYASADDVIDQNLNFYVDTGAADAYVVTPSPSLGAYAEGQRLVFRAVNTNTGASTLNANALGAIAIQTSDGNALTAGMIAAAGYYEVTYDVNASPDRWVLTSPHSFQPIITAGSGMTGGGTLPASVTLNVIGGTGITANANDIELDAASPLNDDHSAISVTAGTGMTGGGTIDATKTLNVIGGDGITANANDIALSTKASTTTNAIDITSGVPDIDISNLTSIQGNLLNTGDQFYVSDGGVNKSISYGEMGLKVQLGQTTQTLALTDANKTLEFNGTATVTIPLNSSVAMPIGCAVIVVVDHATQQVTITAATSVTLNSIFHPGGGAAASDKVISGGMAILTKTETDEWYLSGDIVT